MGCRKEKCDMWDGFTKTIDELSSKEEVEHLKEEGMSKIQLLKRLLFIIVAELSYSSHGDVGTSSQYSPPYIPTVCYGNDPTQFPSSNLFAAAGDGIWDNGAACGRQYLVRCISASQPGTCVP
ncbi:hypothetical protein L1049_000271 [Liquidambar formosana]|uniref:Expansin-like EG45 domain-containing protein n=1 Tax=Liquidambar formosana TaxID=63359 RepID=A0AAP0N8H9_LIQFO